MIQRNSPHEALERLETDDLAAFEAAKKMPLLEHVRPAPGAPKAPKAATPS